jgi:xylulokinase
MLVKLGGAGDILYCVDSMIVDPRLYLDYHVTPERYLVNGCMASSGSILKWFRGNFAAGADFEQLDNEATSVAAGSNGLIVLPYFLGEKTPINDPAARGVFFGLTLGHSRAHAYRAILEGISMGFRHHLQVLAERGLTATKARVTNGGARSALWKQVTADVLGIPLEQVANHPGSSMGAAFIAGMGVGAFKHWNEIERFVHIHTIIEPNPSANSLYSSTYPIYRELYERNRTLFDQLS